jgi:hypothetical protein
VDGSHLLDCVRLPESPPGLWELPGLEALRRIWLPQYDRCTVAGRKVLRWRTRDEQPPAEVRIASPYDLEARYSSIRDTHWWATSSTSPRPVIQVIAWLWGEPLGARRRQPGHFTQLSPYPLSRQTVLC